MTVVFSLHPVVETQAYSIVSSPFPELTLLTSKRPLPNSEVPVKATDTHQVLQACQKLLWSVYHRDMRWHPSSTFHSKFDIKEDEQLFVTGMTRQLFGLQLLILLALLLPIKQISRGRDSMLKTLIRKAITILRIY